MKKVLSAVIAVLLFSVCFPAAAQEAGSSIFDTAFTLVENEPEVEYDKWDIPHNVWIPAENTVLTAGETASVMLEYSVPEAAALSGFTERQLASIEFLISISGLENIELAEAQNCPKRTECDYDTGICTSVPGEYANITMTENGCTVMAELNKTVIIVFRGTVKGALRCKAEINIGQYRFPAQFIINNSVMTVEKTADGKYSAQYSDFTAVRKKAVLFHNSENGKSCTKFAALNGHYYRIIIENGAITGFMPVDENFADSGEPVDTDSKTSEMLTAIFNEFAEFFNIPCDAAAVSDADFLGDAQHSNFITETVLGGENPGSVSKPAPSVSKNLIICLAIIGTAAVVCAAAVITIRRRRK